MVELLECVLIALACPLVLPIIIDVNKEGENNGT